MNAQPTQQQSWMKRYREMKAQIERSPGNMGEQSSVIPDSWRGQKDQPIFLSNLRYLPAGSMQAESKS